MEMRSSLARSTASKLNDGEGGGPVAWGSNSELWWCPGTCAQEGKRGELSCPQWSLWGSFYTHVQGGWNSTGWHLAPGRALQ
jgi:hypothetical protein